MNVEINPSDYKILVVDDVQANVMLLKILLTNEKYQIVTAMNGVEALEKVKTENPDLILLDIMMPGMDGFEVAETLKNDSKYHDIPIVFLTALCDPKDIVKGFKVGASDYISKPFNKEELIIRVTHQISLVAAKRIILNKTEELKNTIIGRDKLYSMVAHDLRSPMGSLKMMLNMLMVNLPEKVDGDMLDMLTLANDTSEEVFSLLDSLLNWTKDQYGRLKIVCQNLDLVEITRDVLLVFTMVAQSKNVKITLDTPPRVEVFADIDIMKTVIRNLLSNAIKYSDDGGEVIVSMEVKNGNAIVHIQDFGKGIRDEDQSKILNADESGVTDGPKSEDGSGLGLLLCQDFVIKSGGKLWFTSEEGVGSIFSFSIPQKPESDSIDKA